MELSVGLSVGLCVSVFGLSVGLSVELGVGLSVGLCSSVFGMR